MSVYKESEKNEKRNLKLNIEEKHQSFHELKDRFNVDANFLNIHGQQSDQGQFQGRRRYITEPFNFMIKRPI